MILKFNKLNKRVMVMKTKHSFGFEKKNFGSPRGMGILAPIGKKPAYAFYGDYDGDGVINGLDCEPRNRFKQGPQHELTQEQKNHNKSQKEKWLAAEAAKEYREEAAEGSRKHPDEDQLGWSGGKGSKKASENITGITKQMRRGWVPHTDED